MSAGLPEDSDSRLISSPALNWLCVLAGPILGGLVAWLLPETFQPATGLTEPVTLAIRVTLGALVWMAVWWLTQCFPLWVTALVPLLLFPLTKAAPLAQVAEAYVDPTIRLFLGGFLISAAIGRWGLGERFSLLVLRSMGSRPRNLVAGLMLVTATISAFVSNAATAAVMLPIALSLTRLVGEQNRDLPGVATRFGTCCMLGVAYAASIGGLVTLLGSPPNLILAGFLNNIADPAQRIEVTFLSWLGIGLPFALLMLPACWWLLTCWLFRLPNEGVPAAEREVRSRLVALGRLSRGEFATLCSFLLAVVLWIASPWLKPMALSFGAETVRPFAWLSDWRVGAMAAGLLILWPVSLRPLTFALEIPDFKRVPWSVLILFGGGLALSAAMTSSHADKMLAAGLEFFQTWPRPLAVLVFVVAVIFFTEIASNTATTATALPIFGALAESWSIHPAYLAVPITIAASCAFMLPVGTPPNAIVFASGQVSGRDMIRAGWWLNWIAVAVIALISNLLVEWFLL